jgi:hypothetical protein
VQASQIADLRKHRRLECERTRGAMARVMLLGVEQTLTELERMGAVPRKL